MDFVKKINKKLDYHLEPYEILGNAVILQAKQDYYCQINIIKNDPNNCIPYARKSAKEILKFFNSKQFQIFTSIDPGYLIRKMNEELGVSEEFVRRELNR